METLPGGMTLEIPQGCFPLSTDSMLLAHFVRLAPRARVLDLGSGCGTLGLLLCAGDPGCTVTGVEIDPAAHAAALENIRRNGLEPRMESICADLRSVSGRFSPGSFCCCVTNPPYFSAGAASARYPAARRDDLCPLPELLAAAAWAVKYGGDVYLVHRPGKLGQLLSAAGKVGLEGKELCLVRHRPDSPASLILLRLRKGGKPGLAWQEWTLYDSDGRETELYRQIYHIM